MSTIQKVLLVASCILFAATIYSYFNFQIYFVILFFLLHSLCLILFVYRTFSDMRMDLRSMETYHQDIGLEIAGKNKEVDTLKSTLGEKEEDIERLNVELNDLKVKCAEYEGNIKDLNEEKEVLLEREKQAELSVADRDIGALLPPVKEENGDRDTVNIIEIANRAKEELLSDAMSANMSIQVSSATDTLLVKADANRLLVLFRNIIDNSIKYMKRAGSLVITISTIGEDIFIVLKDTGEGLPEEETKHIFELNFQGSNRISGNGLGLAQARAIVECYGGTIYARSTEGNGMGIYIQLPA